MRLMRSFVNHPKESLIIFLLAITASLGGKCVILSKQLQDANDTIENIGAKTVIYNEDQGKQLFSIRTEVQKYILEKYKDSGKAYFHYTGNVAQKPVPKR